MNNPNVYRAYAMRVKYSEASEQEPPEEYANDVTSFVCIRNAVQKTASFSILTLNMPIDYYSQYQTLVTSGLFPEIEIELEMLDTTVRGDEIQPLGRRILRKPIFRRLFKITHMIDLEPPDIETRTIHVMMMLTNPLLHFLGTRLTFNKPLSGRPVDVLDKFEKYLNEVYTSKSSPYPAFKFHRCANDKLITPYSYEQILLRAENDLQIPKLLINLYKVYQVPSLYIFDEFRFDPETEASIHAYLLNFGDEEKFEKEETSLRDLTNNVNEIISTVDYVKGLGIATPYSPIINPVTVLNIYNYDMAHIGQHFLNETFESPHVYLEKEEDEYPLDPDFYGKRKISLKYEKNDKFLDGRVQTSLDLYTPDNDRLAVERYRLTKELLKKIPMTEVYSFNNIFFEYFQFGKRYNLSWLEELDPGSDTYLYTPVCIINYFTRVEGPMPILRHSAKIQFVKFSEVYAAEKDIVDYVGAAESAKVEKRQSVSVPFNQQQLPNEAEIDEVLNSSQQIKCNEELLTNQDLRNKLIQYIRTKSGGQVSVEEAEKIIDAAAETENPHYFLATIAKESAFRSRINNKGLNPDGSVDYGICQINVKNNDISPYRKFGVNSIEDLYDPYINMKIGAYKLFRINPPSKRGNSPEARAFYDQLSDIEKNAIVYGGATSLEGMKFVLANISYQYNDLKQYLGGIELRPSDPNCIQNAKYKGTVRSMSLSQINKYRQEWARKYNVSLRNISHYTRPPVV